MPEYHTYDTVSFHLKLSPSEYTSYDVFHCMVERNLNDRGGAAAAANRFSNHRMIREMISKICAFVEKKKGRGTTYCCCQNMDMLVVLSFRLEIVLDGRIQHSWHSNGGMTHHTCLQDINNGVAGENGD
ncbi:hypothetical protein HAX54_002416 [Datura stramonium]|uniref:Uncharacterized protein n=1 Tax=Datura stramonium TaxID=4076 RepID=A0ABS8T5E5_DATST|nr:hypothetical protein [Datura stramonium]